MATSYLFDPGRLARFSPERATKTDVVRGERLFVGLTCYEPGQSEAVHAHSGADKFYLIVTGKARMLVGAERFDAAPGAVVWAPAGVPHGVEEAIERTTILIAIAPPPPARPAPGT